ncbi:MAG TPA: tetratricopeptide repeat protein [candidate division Zixibacteria bacterium]|nr:tetratricopeptide repeat protein [candidate division Zixibacteria bacterium]
MTNSQLDKEEQDYRELLENDPNNIGALANLGKVLSEKQNYSEAEIIFKRALKLAPEDEWILFELGYALSVQNKLDEAEEIFRKVLEKNQENTNVWFNLALILNRKQDWDGTKEAYRKVLEIDPKDAFTWLNLGVLHNKLKEIDKAEKAYRKALEIHPDYTKAAFNLGKLLEEKNDVFGAAEVLLETFKLNPYCTILLRDYFRVTKKSFYIPMVVNASPKKYFEFNEYRVVILDEIQSMGKIGYKYLLFLYKGDDVFPLFYVSLENNALYDELGGTSHFLCAFDKEQGHVNFGGFENETTIENFTQKALEVVSDKYKIKIDDFKEV